MKRLLLWTAGIVVGIWVVDQVRRSGGTFLARAKAMDLNKCSREELLALAALDAVMADRIIENRPYRHRLDLVARMVIPSGVYQSIRDRVDVASNTAGQAVNVAS